VSPSLSNRFIFLTSLLLAPGGVTAQEAVTLPEALARARATSPSIRAAASAAAGAREAERQTRAFPNPVLSADLERTTRDDLDNTVTTFRLAQPLDVWGTRGLQTEAASQRRAASEAALLTAEVALDTTVVGAWARAVAAGERAALLGRVVAAFDTAERVSRARLEADDVSGYSHRRLRLEAARYAADEAQARFEFDRFRRALAQLIGSTADPATLRLPARLTVHPWQPELADLQAGLAGRPDLRAAELMVGSRASAADAVARSRIPVPVLIGGYKAERVPGETGSYTGFVAGIALPVPLWDRRGGARSEAVAETERARWEAEAARQTAARELDSAWEALRLADAQAEALASRLDADASPALNALQAAWREGDLSLLEWLDGVRAWHDAFAALAALQAERLVRQAALAAASGRPVAPTLMEAR